LQLIGHRQSFRIPIIDFVNGKQGLLKILKFSFKNGNLGEIHDIYTYKLYKLKY